MRARIQAAVLAGRCTACWELLLRTGADRGRQTAQHQPETWLVFKKFKETVAPSHERWPTIQSCEYVLSYDSLYDDPDHLKIVAEACAEFAKAYF
jgi:hypothetical protein